MKNHRKKRYKVISGVSLIMFFVIWQVYAMLNAKMGWMNKAFLPAPTEVLVTFKKFFDEGTLFVHIGVSMLRIFKGFFIGTVVGVIVGYIMAKLQIFESILQPIINILGAIPPYAFMPLLIIWFGVGEFAKIVMIVLATFIPVLASTIQGVKSINPLHIRSAKTLGCNELQLFYHVVVKTALPFIIAGMKTSISLCFSALVVAEMIGSDTGLGFIIVDGRNWFKVANMFMAMTSIALLQTIFQGILTMVERKLFKWKKEGLSSAIE
ncbi:MAG: ABC transporter permease [Eubacteriales bacterium]|nr:ABC transporter permease [Eubacteriales bacterium]